MIKNSISSHNVAWYGGGGLIYFHGSGNTEFSNCVIYNNTATFGRGLYIRSNSDGCIKLSNCNIYNNTAKVNARGLQMLSLVGSNSVFIKCSIYDNAASV